MEKGEAISRPVRGAEYFGPMGSVDEEYQTYLMIFDIEKKEKEVKQTSWLSRLFHRKV
jgi:hypothetical protein